MNCQDLKKFSETTMLPLDQLQKYIDDTDKSQKQFICAYWLRGTCIFPKELCHHAHGFQDLDYSITSNKIRLPYLPKSVTERQAYFKLDRAFYVLEQSQMSEFVQKEVKKFSKSVGLEHEEGKVFSLQEIQDNRKMRSTILTYTLLEDLIKFTNFIFTSLGPASPVPKTVIVNELQRVGYCQVGGRTYKPGTILYHLQSYGVCFQTDVYVKDFKIEDPAYEQTILNNNNKKIADDSDERPVKDQLDEEKGQDKQDGEEEDFEGEEEPEMVQTEGDPITFFVPIYSLVETTNKFSIIFHQVMADLLGREDDKLDYETLMFAVDSRVDEHNQKVFPDTVEMLPHLEQILKILNVPFNEYFALQTRPNYPSISVFEGKGFDECGLHINQISKNFNEKQKQCLAEYLSGPKSKFYLCRYWLRGMCIFKKEDCRLAHGINDIQCTDLDMNINHKQMESIQLPLRVDQKQLIIFRTYRILYFYQFELLKQGKIEKDQLKTVFEIDQVKEYRDNLRRLIRHDVVINFYLKISKGIPQRLSYIEKYFKYCGFHQTELSEHKITKILLCTNTCFERDIEEETQQQESTQFETQQQESSTMKDQEEEITVQEKKYKNGKKQCKQKGPQKQPKQPCKKKIGALQKVTYLIPFRSIEQVQDYYISLVVGILINEVTIQLSQQLDGVDFESKVEKFPFLPLSEQVIKKQINQLDKLIDMPGFYNYLRMSGKRISISNFIRDRIFPILGEKLEAEGENILNSETTQQKWKDLSELLKQNPQDFLILDDDMEGIELFISEILRELTKRQKYIINVEKMQKIVEQQFKHQQIKMQVNDKLKLFLRDNIVYGDQIKLEFTNYFLQTYNQGLFVIINPKEKIQNQLTQKLKKCKCGQVYYFPTDQTKVQVHNDRILDNLRDSIIQMGLMDPIVRNTMIVDDEVKLQICYDVFKHVNFVGVDFEGQLKHGVLWLAQLGIQIKGTKRLIIILDLMNAQFIQKDALFHKQLLSFLRSVMEDHTIRKVFHDCRRDSSALHQNDICTKNATDTSVTFSLFQQITYFDSWKQQQETKTSLNTKDKLKKEKSLNTVLSDIHQFCQPSLNQVLLNWNAMNSQNDLKGQFHGHFANSNNEYFFQRPHPEFMSYSARDVEDLTEVQTRMECSLQTLLTDPLIIEKLTTKNLQYFL